MNLVLSRTALFAALLTLAALVAAPLTSVHAQTTTMPLCEINRGLTVGASGEDVRCLQRYLNWSGYSVAATGVGSPGNETSYFGPLTANAVARWQNAHSQVVLVPLGIPQGTGFWGNSSFGHYVALVRIALGLGA